MFYYTQHLTSYFVSNFTQSLGWLLPLLCLEGNWVQIHLVLLPINTKALPHSCLLSGLRWQHCLALEMQHCLYACVCFVKELINWDNHSLYITWNFWSTFYMLMFIYTLNICLYIPLKSTIKIKIGKIVRNQGRKITALHGMLKIS